MRIRILVKWRLLPSQKIDPDKLKHLSAQQKKELLSVLDKYPECFSDKPGLCTMVTHELNVTSDFKPKRLRAYRVPESLKPEVEKQIQEMLQMGIIKPQKSEMASPIVCVLKGKDGKDGVRIAIDCRYLNKFCLGDAYPTPDIRDIIQRVWKAPCISTCGLKGAYWQICVKEDHQWLTAFVWDGGLYEFTRAPFGQKGSGNSFMRAIKMVVQPRKTVQIHMLMTPHIKDLESFLKAISHAGMTLNLTKCEFAKGEVRFVGHLIGSGQRRVDPDRIKAIKDMKIPQSKKQVRQIMGFFSYFRDYIPNFSALAKPLTDLTAKKVPNQIPWGQAEQMAFEKLKTELCKATDESLAIVDFNKPLCVCFCVMGVHQSLERDAETRTRPMLWTIRRHFASSHRLGREVSRFGGLVMLSSQPS